MICPNCGTRFNCNILVNLDEFHIEDDIYVGKELIYKADYTNPLVVSGCPNCWYPLSGEQADIDRWKEQHERRMKIFRGEEHGEEKW